MPLHVCLGLLRAAWCRQNEWLTAVVALSFAFIHRPIVIVHLLRKISLRRIDENNRHAQEDCPAAG